MRCTIMCTRIRSASLSGLHCILKSVHLDHGLRKVPNAIPANSHSIQTFRAPTHSHHTPPTPIPCMLIQLTNPYLLLSQPIQTPCYHPLLTHHIAHPLLHKPKLSTSDCFHIDTTTQPAIEVVYLARCTLSRRPPLRRLISSALQLSNALDCMFPKLGSSLT